MLGFIRIIIALQVTETLGPIISTIIYMFSDIGVFIVIWFINLVTFSMVGVLTFNEVPALTKFQFGIIYFFEASFGNFDTTVFDVYIEDWSYRPVLREIGIYFVLTFIFLNLLILLNFVIAMMADTYSLMTSVRKGLYNYNIIHAAPAYKLDKYYGGLILMMPPFCMITFILLPVYVFRKDRQHLAAFNKKVYQAAYFFIALVIGLVFFAVNLLLMPFAYLKTCWHKLNLVRHSIIPFCKGLSYILYGLPLMLIAQITDLWEFLKVNSETRKRY